MKKVLYISYDGMTDPLGQSQVLPYLAGLSKKGYRFHILSFEKQDRFDKEGHLIQKICDQNGIQWEPVPFHTQPPVLAKIYDRYLMRRKALSLHSKLHFDMVHCRSYPAAEVGLYLKEKKGVGFLFDMRGFWPDEKVDAGRWDLRRPWYRRIYKHYKNLEKRFLLESDHVISLTEAGKKELLRQYSGPFTEWDKENNGRNGSLGHKISVIPCCADLHHFDYHPIDASKKKLLRERLGIQREQRVVSYSGTLGTWYMMDEMLNFFNRYKEKHKDAVFLCMTKEPKAEMDAYISRNGVDPSSVITTYAGRDELPLYLSLSDFSVFFIRSTYSKISSSPTKHAELMGLGIPVVCNDLGDTGTIVRSTGTGIVVERFDEEEFGRAVDAIDEFRGTKELIRESAFKFFSLENALRTYERIYQNILKTNN